MYLCVIYFVFIKLRKSYGIDPSSLKNTSKTNYVLIEKDFRWEEKFKLANNIHYMTLKSGKYIAYLDSNKGTYYEGKNKCLQWEIIATSKDEAVLKNDFLNCGVYVPNNADSRMIVYYYIDPEASKAIIDQNKAGLIIAAFDRAEWNNLKHLIYQPESLKLQSQVKVIDN